jgi:hypothetical protein
MTTIYVTNKEDLPVRHDNDEYITEMNLVKAAILTYAPFKSFSVLDIGAGDGRWGAVAATECGASLVTGVEIQNLPQPEAFSLWYPNQDFMAWNTTLMFDLIVSNPPYFIAEEIIRKAWDLLAYGGTMMMLLRLAFQSGVGRYNGLWSEIYPETVAVCSRRPSFYGGKTNGTDYGVFIWHKGLDGRPVGKPRSWKTELLLHERDK